MITTDYKHGFWDITVIKTVSGYRYRAENRRTGMQLSSEHVVMFSLLGCLELALMEIEETNVY